MKTYEIKVFRLEPVFIGLIQANSAKEAADIVKETGIGPLIRPDMVYVENVDGKEYYETRL